MLVDKVWYQEGRLQNRGDRVGGWVRWNGGSLLHIPFQAQPWAGIFLGLKSSFGWTAGMYWAPAAQRDALCVRFQEGNYEISLKETKSASHAHNLPFHLLHAHSAPGKRTPRWTAVTGGDRWILCSALDCSLRDHENGTPSSDLPTQSKKESKIVWFSKCFYWARVGQQRKKSVYL